MDDHQADELLKRALLDAGASAAVALKVGGLPVAESVTVVFHGRQDLGTIQTYVAPGRHGAGDALSPSDLMRVPCDLDLGDAEDREDAERMYAEQARAMRDALEAADVVLELWREPLEDLVKDHVKVDLRTDIGLSLPAHRLMPSALVAPERRIVVTPVCGARRLAEGRPPMGIACAQQDVARVYPLPDDPERCIEDFLEAAAEHARRMASTLERQEQSVRRFLELSGEDFEETT